MATTLIDVVEVQSEDADLVAQLAKLQQMHQQVNDLRRLLPTALFGPAREAISQPSKVHPRALAVAVSKAAQKGTQDVQAFKKDWHDEKTRQLFKEANAANTPQGIDAWLVDYRTLNTTRSEDVPTKIQADDIPFDTLEEAMVAIENFQKSDKHAKVAAASDSSPFPLTVHIARFELKVSRDESAATYKIEQDSTEVKPKLLRQIIKQIDQSGPFKKLDELLALVDAYHNVRLDRCEKCQSLVDSSFDYPLVRKHIVNVSKSDSPSVWLAYHTGCAE